MKGQTKSKKTKIIKEKEAKKKKRNKYYQLHHRNYREMEGNEITGTKKVKETNKIKGTKEEKRRKVKENEVKFDNIKKQMRTTEKGRMREI